MRKIIVTALVVFITTVIFACASKVHAEELKTYTVQPGDSLSSIALAQLGDLQKWQDIYSLNQSQISNPNVIYAGEILTLPQSIENTTPAPVAASAPEATQVTQSVDMQTVYTPPVVVHTSVTYARNNPYYIGLVNDAAAQYHVSASLMIGIIACESGFNPNSYNAYSGASGIAQFMLGTYEGSWNIYRTQYPYPSPEGEIKAMALKISEGGVRAWACYKG